MIQSKMTKKILVIDDKNANEDFSMMKAVNNLTTDESKLVDFSVSPKLFWTFNGEYEIKLLTDFKNYFAVFIHDSHEDALINEQVKPLVITEINKTCEVIFFSGAKPEISRPNKQVFDKNISLDSLYHEINRKQLFLNFQQFIQTEIRLGNYDLRVLYDSSFNPQRSKANSLWDAVKVKLEVSLVYAVESKEYDELLNLFKIGSKKAQVINNCLTLDDDEFIDLNETLIERIK